MPNIEQLKRNYLSVLERMQKAAQASDRNPAEVKLVAVTKYVDSSLIRELHGLGCRDFGESRPQVLWQKAEELQDLDLCWHQIGHLQTNKVRRTIPLVSMIHAGDSIKLLECINEEARKVGKTVDVLCEVNISGDSSKHGFTTQALQESVEAISQMSSLRVKGLMAMASRSGGAERAQRDFEALHAFGEELKSLSPESIEWKELSMGMSGDFEEAIQCGATLVRIGSILFEGV